MALIALGAALGAGAGALSAGANIYAAKLEDKAYRANAAVKRDSAKQVVEKGKWDADKLGVQFGRNLSAGRVGAAGSNIMLGSGSLVDWEGDLSDAYVSDQSMLKYNTRLQEVGLLNSANMDIYMGKAGVKGAYVSGIASVLGGGMSGAAMGMSAGSGAKAGAGAGAGAAAK